MYGMRLQIDQIGVLMQNCTEKYVCIHPVTSERWGRNHQLCWCSKSHYRTHAKLHLWQACALSLQKISLMFYFAMHFVGITPRSPSKPQNCMFIPCTTCFAVKPVASIALCTLFFFYHQFAGLHWVHFWLIQPAAKVPCNTFICKSLISHSLVLLCHTHY